MTAFYQSFPIPAQSVGVGLKPAHYRDVLSPRDGAKGAGGSIHDAVNGVQFFEVHAENFMGDGGPPHAWLSAIREKFPLSVHGVCLSIGGANPLDRDHLKRLRAVVDRYEPALVSEHLAWCAHDGVFHNDLIAPPLTDAAFRKICDHIDETQEALGRRILIENPSQYLKMPGDIAEPDFLNALAHKTGCGLLLDINNVFVSASNLRFDAGAYLDGVNAAYVGEIHLAGHTIDDKASVALRIDDHGSPVPDEVGALYRDFIKRAGPRPTLVEWDTDVPAFATLCAEAHKAARWMADALDIRKTPKEAAHAGR